MKLSDNFCIIMAGGIGSRFWPKSRESHPKQFIDFLGMGKSLLQLTYERFLGIIPPENIFVITHRDYLTHVQNQLPMLSPARILSEPSRKNTAPCVAYASFKIQQIHPEANIIVAPSDHLILKSDVFHEIVQQAFSFVSSHDALVTIGITPNRPDTGYGYIQYSEEGYPPFLKVKTFTEKPSLEIARSFLASGDFVWNSGMFIWNVRTILKSFEEYASDIYSLFYERKDALHGDTEYQAIEEIYALTKNISVDYAILEKAPNVYVISADIGWSDLGTWGSIYEKLTHDAHANAVVGKYHLLYDTRNCMIHLPRKKLAIIEGLQDFIVIDTEDALLICRNNSEQRIKDFVNDIKLKKWKKFL